MKRIALLLAMTWLSGCSSVAVTSDGDPNVDFSQFKTFVITGESGPEVSRMVDARIRIAIVKDLTSKGFTQEGVSDQADLAVGYQVAAEARRSYQSMHSAWGTNGFRYNNTTWGATGVSSRSVQSTYTAGTLLIAVFQMTDQELVWEATGNRRVTESGGKEASAQERMNEDIQKVMRNFPPGN